jgi:hypothetical protein
MTKRVDIVFTIIFHRVTACRHHGKVPWCGSLSKWVELHFASTFHTCDMAQKTGWSILEATAEIGKHTLNTNLNNDIKQYEKISHHRS